MTYVKQVAAVVFWAVSGAFGLSAQTVPQDRAEMSFSFAPVVRKAAPSVVNVYARVMVEERRSPFAGDPFFEGLFQDLGSRRRMQQSLGSGVIIGADGGVITNYHVIANASEIQVELADRRVFQARVLLADEQADLAMLQLENARDLPALPLRNSDRLEVGELVLAIGNPFGVGQTVSSGIISGLGRSTLSLGGGRGYFVQTDAAINPGNSGGALVDVGGRLIGINTAILTKGGGSNGIGFAIPANLVQSFMDQARQGRPFFQRPWTGVSGRMMDAQMADAFGLPRPAGVVVSGFHPASPFLAAGLEVGDVILSLNGEPTDSPQEVSFRLASIGIGQGVDVRYLHQGQERHAHITLIAPPEAPPRDTLVLGSASLLQGVSVARINPAVAAQFRLPDDLQGVAVSDVAGPARDSGLKVGDVILAINGVAVSQPGDIQNLTMRAKRRRTIEFWRKGRVSELRFRG